MNVFGIFDSKPNAAAVESAAPTKPPEAQPLAMASTYNALTVNDPEEPLATTTLSPQPSCCGGLVEVLCGFAPLGWVAFGGPQAHVALLHTTFVEKKRWLTDDTFTELLALGHALPGPTSSQMVVAVAASRGGLLGALLAFVLWSLPAFCALLFASYGVNNAQQELSQIWWLQGLPPAAVSLVFAAAYKICAKCCPDNLTRAICMLSALAVVLTSADPRVPLHAFDVIYPGLLVLGGLVTICSRCGQPALMQTTAMNPGVTKCTGAFLFLVWAGVFTGLAYLRFHLHSTDMYVLLAETFWRIGSVVFGGGQVVLPMLVTQVVEPGWVTVEEFYSGMALTQACPGPLFNFSAYLGGVVKGFSGALVSQLSLFGPGCLLILGVSPFWVSIRKIQCVKAALIGINAAAAGLIVAALVMLYQQTVKSGANAAVVLVTATLGSGLGVPAPLAIFVGGSFGALLGFYDVATEPF